VAISIRNIILIQKEKSSFSHYKNFIFEIFPLLDLNSNIFLLSNAFSNNFSPITQILNQLITLLKKYPFYRINFRPIHPFPENNFAVRRLKEIYKQIHDLIFPLLEEAYLNQSIARLIVLPIIQLSPDHRLEEVSKFLHFLRDQSFIPSIYFQNHPPSLFLRRLINLQQERLYLEIGKGTPEERVVKTIYYNLQGDELLSWIDSSKGDLPKSRSIIFSEEGQKIFFGLNKFLSNNPLPIDSVFTLISEIEKNFSSYSEELLLDNLAVAHQLKETLCLNNRHREVANIFFYLGLALVQKEDFSRALEQFSEVLTFPSELYDHQRVWLFKALCHLRLHDLKSAQLALNMVEKKDPDNPMLHYLQGQVEFELKDYIEAIERFKKALKINPRQIPADNAWFYMALSHINILEYDEGLICLKEAEKVFSPDKLSPIFYYQGICFLGKNELDNAYKLFQKALNSNPAPEDLSSIYLYLGICHKEKGEYLIALDYLQKALAAEKDRLEVYNLMGFCYFKIKDYDRAIECFVKAIEIDPLSAIDWANLGVNLKAKGEKEKAILILKKALSLDPTIGFARKHLNELLEKKTKAQ